MNYSDLFTEFSTSDFSWSISKSAGQCLQQRQNLINPIIFILWEFSLAKYLFIIKSHGNIW